MTRCRLVMVRSGVTAIFERGGGSEARLTDVAAFLPPLLPSSSTLIEVASIFGRRYLTTVLGAAELFTELVRSIRLPLGEGELGEGVLDLELGDLESKRALVGGNCKSRFGTERR